MYKRLMSFFVIFTLVFFLYASPATAKSVATKFCAHRGYQVHEPENTLEAVKSAIQHKFSMVEIDPRRTRDNNWVLLHDYTLDRTTNGTGYIASVNWSYVKTLKIDTPSDLVGKRIIRIPTLASVLQLCSKTHTGINIDGKDFISSKTNAQFFYSLLKKYGLVSNSVISGYSKAYRKIIYRYAPKIRILWVTKPANLKNDLKEAKLYKYNVALAYFCNELTDDVVRTLHKYKIKVYVINADSVKDARKWLGKADYIETNSIAPEDCRK